MNQPALRRFTSSDDDTEPPLKITVEPKYLERIFLKSSGPGGQNVNKVNTKVELRMNINTNMSPWLPDHVKKRLRELKPQYISSAGWFIVTS